LGPDANIFLAAGFFPPTTRGSTRQARVLVELIEQGLEASRQKEQAYFELAERFRAAS
jgi:hypothetical protein